MAAPEFNQLARQSSTNASLTQFLNSEEDFHEQIYTIHSEFDTILNEILRRYSIAVDSYEKRDKRDILQGFLRRCYSRNAFDEYLHNLFENKEIESIEKVLEIYYEIDEGYIPGEEPFCDFISNTNLLKKLKNFPQTLPGRIRLDGGALNYLQQKNYDMDEFVKGKRVFMRGKILIIDGNCE